MPQQPDTVAKESWYAYKTHIESRGPYQTKPFPTTHKRHVCRSSRGYFIHKIDCQSSLRLHRPKPDAPVQKSKQTFQGLSSPTPSHQNANAQYLTCRGAVGSTQCDVPDSSLSYIKSTPASICVQILVHGLLRVSLEGWCLEHCRRAARCGKHSCRLLVRIMQPWHRAASAPPPAGRTTTGSTS